jgi:mRNA interferase HigB
VPIIKIPFLKAQMKAHPRAEEILEEWIARVKAARWRNPVEMKRDFPTVDPAKVKSGSTVYIFNIRRNEYRLIAAVHFDKQRAYTLRFLTHAEYDLAHWKEEL